MNRIYRVVYNAHTQTHQAVSEHGKGRHKTQSCSTQNGTTVSAPARIRVPFLPTAIIGALLAFTGISTAQAAPQGGEVVRGAATISQQGKLTDIHQTTPKAAINWQKFGIKHDETVQFRQPDTRSIMLNRVIGNERSVIDGALRANGKVFVLNPHGTLIGNGAKINVGGLIVSSANISDQDFMAGKYRFHNGKGNVTNLGNISVPEGGTVALIAPIVNNQGKINTPKGNAILASAKAFTLTFAGDNFSYTLDQGTLQGLVDNGGVILADGGHIVLTAKGTDSIKKSLIKHSGIAQANTVKNQNGVIELLGDLDNTRLAVSGSLKAEAPNSGDGGFIETSAATVQIADTTQVSTQATHGKTGTWLIDPTDFTISAGTNAHTQSSIGADTLSKNLNTNNVQLTTSAKGVDKGDININASVNWNKNTLTLTAHNNININANLNGDGTAKLGLEYGQATENGSEADYHLKKGVRVNLPEGNSFSIKKGSTGKTEQFQVFHKMPEIQKPASHLIYESGFNATNIAFGKDLDLSYTKNYPEFTGWSLQNYSHIAGLGHHINNLTLDSKTQNNVALFRSGLEGSIRDIGLNNANVQGDYQVGGLLGSNAVSYDYSQGIEIKNSFVNGNISGNGSVGGLAGFTRGIIKNSFSTGTVSGLNNIGGLIGKHIFSIENSYSKSNVSLNKPKDQYNSILESSNIGGLVGETQSSYIKNSYSTGNITTENSTNVGGLVGAFFSYSAGHTKQGELETSYSNSNISNTGKNTGGLVGFSTINISNSYSQSNINGGENTGGLVGFQTGNTSIAKSYAAGKVQSNNVDTTGAIIGNFDLDNSFKGELKDIFFNKDTTNQNLIVGKKNGTISADINGSQTKKHTTELNKASYLIAKNNTEMQQKSTFKGWDFEKIWRIDEGKDYPRLRALTEGKITIAADKSDLSVQAPNVSKTYDGVPIKNVEDLKALKGWGKGISVTGLLDNDTAASGLKNLTIDPTRGGWVGAVDVKKDGYDLYPIADVSDNFKQKYEIDWQKGSLMIHPKKLSITSVSLYGERPYDGTTAARAKEVKELKGIVEKDKNTVKLTGIGTLAGADVVANGTQKLVSLNYHDNKTKTNHVLKLTGEGSQNYELTTNGSEWKITKRPISILGTRVYDGTKQARAEDVKELHNIVEKDKNTVKLTGIGTLAGADVVANGTGTQKLQSLNTLKLTGNSSKNYEITVKDSTWKITKRPLIITAMNNFKPLYEKNPSKDKIGILASGLVNGEIISQVDIQFGKNDKEAQTAELHEVYPVSPTNVYFQKGKGKKENYEIKLNNGKILVIPKHTRLNKAFPRNLELDKEKEVRNMANDLTSVYDEMLLANAVYGAGSALDGIQLGDNRRFHEVWVVDTDKVEGKNTVKGGVGNKHYYFCPIGGCDDKRVNLTGKVYKQYAQGKKLFELLEIIDISEDGKQYFSGTVTSDTVTNYRADNLKKIDDDDTDYKKGAGLSAAVYKKVSSNQNDEQQIFVVFRGTDDGNAVSRKNADGRTNLSGGLQYDVAYEWAKQQVENIVQEYPNAKISFVGHSLGGGLATFATVSIGHVKKKNAPATKINATVFNAAQLGPVDTAKAIANYVFNNDDHAKELYKNKDLYAAAIIASNSKNSVESVSKKYGIPINGVSESYLSTGNMKSYAFNNDVVSSKDFYTNHDFYTTRDIDFISEANLVSAAIDTSIADHGMEHIHFNHYALNIVQENYDKLKKDKPVVVNKHIWVFNNPKKNKQLNKMEEFLANERKRQEITSEIESTREKQNLVSLNNQLKQVDKLSSKQRKVILIPGSLSSPLTGKIILNIHIYRNNKLTECSKKRQSQCTLENGDIVKYQGSSDFKSVKGTIKFSDGSRIELEADSVVKINFDHVAQSSSMAASVRVLKGVVKKYDY